MLRHSREICERQGVVGEALDCRGDSKKSFVRRDPVER
jgi:hypothetical protein